MFSMSVFVRRANRYRNMPAARMRVGNGHAGASRPAVQDNTAPSEGRVPTGKRHEQENLPTEQHEAQENPWISRPHADEDRAGGDQPPPGQGPETAVRLSGAAMPGCALTQSRRLRKTEEYAQVYGKGRRLRGGGFGFVVLPNHQAANRLGISVSGVKSAVRRNRCKRLIREFYRLNATFPARLADRLNLVPPVDVVVTTKSFQPDSLQEVSQAFWGLVGSSPSSSPSPACG